ncbi:MAG: GNAT family N-acetyltransferase [Gemmatimonadota bacterium]|nr:GNAT family N-acetyltransferase [Gemmatimonadota bacterium]
MSQKDPGTEPPTRSAVSRLVHDVRVGIATNGTRAWLGRVADGAAGRVYRRARLVVIEQDLGLLTDVPTPVGIRIAPFHEEWQAVDAIVTSNIMREFRRRHAAGRECLLAWRGDRVVGYTWMSRSCDAVEGLPLALPHDAAYLWDLFVSVSERGSGVGSALTRLRLAWAREAGFARGWRAVSVTNRASLRTAEKTGALRILGEIRIERTLGPRRLIEEPAVGVPLLRR